MYYFIPGGGSALWCNVDVAAENHGVLGGLYCGGSLYDDDRQFSVAHGVDDVHRVGGRVIF